VNEPQFIERGSIQNVAIGENETLLMPSIVPQLTRTPGNIFHVGRSIGADTEAILTELLDALPENLQEWREAGII
jgi:crotonobetainyl-CoA:carnitine CoA-transferase CaiB-like acyl-CoA transferase